jgi:excisionase family DNA binding protein
VGKEAEELSQDMAKSLFGSFFWTSEKEDSPVEQPPVMLRASDIARLLGISVGRTYQLLKSRDLPGVRIGGAIRVPRTAWDKWLGLQSEEALAGLAGTGARRRESGR